MYLNLIKNQKIKFLFCDKRNEFLFERFKIWIFFWSNFKITNQNVICDKFYLILQRILFSIKSNDKNMINIVNDNDSKIIWWNIFNKYQISNFYQIVIWIVVIVMSNCCWNRKNDRWNLKYSMNDFFVLNFFMKLLTCLSVHLRISKINCKLKNYHSKKIQIEIIFVTFKWQNLIFIEHIQLTIKFKTKQKINFCWLIERTNNNAKMIFCNFQIKNLSKKYINQYI